MIQLTYNTVAKPEFIYLVTEDVRIDTTVAKDQLDFLFKLTNDMTGNIIYVYSASVSVFDRYTKLNLAATDITNQNLFNGFFHGLPVGYYGYELYELTKESSATIAKTCSTAPKENSGVIGVVNLSLSGTTVFTQNLTGLNDVYNKELTNLDAGTYNFDINNQCGDVIINSSMSVASINSQSDNTRFLEVTSVTQTTTGINITILSKMPVGHSYGFSIGSAAETQVTDITTNPQTNVFSFPQIGNPTLSANLVECKQYADTGGAAGGGLVVGSTLNIRPLSNPSSYFGITIVLAINDVLLEHGTSTVKEKGSAFISAIYGATSTSTTKGYYTLQGKVTEGKMYISQGEETLKEVTYKEHEEPAGTNYIYYGQ